LILVEVQYMYFIIWYPIIGRVRCKRITHSPFTSALRVLCPECRVRISFSTLRGILSFMALPNFLASAGSMTTLSVDPRDAVDSFSIVTIKAIYGIHRLVL
jgi:hypothetical protein